MLVGRAKVIRDMDECWLVNKDTEGWWAFVFENMRSRCEGVCGPFRTAHLAKTAAEGMSHRLRTTGSCLSCQ